MTLCPPVALPRSQAPGLCLPLVTTVRLVRRWAAHLPIWLCHWLAVTLDKWLPNSVPAAVGPGPDPGAGAPCTVREVPPGP